MKKATTVGELREHLKVFPDDWQVIFGCEELEFYRTKARGEKLVAIEFNHAVYADKGRIIVEELGQGRGACNGAPRAYYSEVACAF